MEEKDPMETQRLFDILNQLKHWKGTRLVFTGGEPTLRSDLAELSERAVAQGLIPLLATNGVGLSMELASRLYQSGIRKASVSLLGHDEVSHDSRTNCAGSFRSAQEGIRRLQEAGIPVQINFVVTRSTTHLLSHLIQLAMDMHAIALHLFLFVPVGRGCDMPGETLPRPQDLLEIFPEILRETKDAPIQTRFTCCPQYLVFLRSQGIDPAPHTAGCGAGKSVLFISARGKVYPCGYFPLEAGDLFQSNAPEIWEQSRILLDLADSLPRLKDCGECAHKRICGGCRARAFANSGDPFGPDPLCPYAPR